MIVHLIAFLAGVILDRIIGDPHGFPHPIRLIGSFIAFLDKRLLSDIKGKDRSNGKEFALGIVMWILVVFVTVAVNLVVVVGCYRINLYLGIAVEAVLTCYILAAKCLRDESMKVYDALENGTIDDARKAVSMIVGRDTENLDGAAVARAAVETVAENTSDGIIAPLIYTFIGGPILGFFYKAVNTMDSMVGYHNDRYEYFGSTAAKMDDVMNFIPSRLSALFMIAAAFVGGKDYSGKGALRIFKRDRFKHKSPNSAQTESACAGALGLRLAGPSSYFGKVVDKPYIGDELRKIENKDIKKACRLMYITEDLCLVTLLVVAVAGILIF